MTDPSWMGTTPDRDQECFTTAEDPFSVNSWRRTRSTSRVDPIFSSAERISPSTASADRLTNRNDSWAIGQQEIERLAKEGVKKLKVEVVF